MTRILVLGSTGLLGHAVLRHLASDPSLEVEGTQRRFPDRPLWLEAEEGAIGLARIFEGRGRYDYLINCIGLLRGEIQEDDSRSVRRAIAVNALFPHHAAELAGAAGARVIHISTDAVFDTSPEPYREDHPPDGADLYGRTKSLGEVNAPNFLSLRCSIIGPDPSGKGGLLEWFLAQPDGGEVRGFTNHWWHGVTTLQFAELCRRIIGRDLFAAIRRESAVHHFAPNRPVTKYELLKIFQEVYRKKVRLVPFVKEGKPIQRILQSRFEILKGLLGQDLDLKVSIRELAHWSESATRNPEKILKGA